MHAEHEGSIGADGSVHPLVLDRDTKSLPEIALHAVRVRSSRSGYSTLLDFVRQQRRALTLSATLTLLASVASLAVPMVIKGILDSFATDRPSPLLVVLLIVLVLGGAVAGFIEWTTLATAAERVVYSARVAMMERLLSTQLPALSGRAPGELVASVTSDTALLREATSSSVIGTLNSVVVGTGTLAMMAYLDRTLFVAALVVTVVDLLAFRAFLPGIAKATEQAQRATARLGGTFASSMQAVRTVKASAAEDRVGRILATHADDARSHAVRAMRATAGASITAQLGMQLGTIVILVVGAVRVQQHALDLPTLIAFMLYAVTLTNPMVELAQHLTTFQNGLAAARRMREIDEMPVESRRLAAEQSATPQPSPGAPSSLEAVIEARSVDFAYPQAARAVLTKLSMVIPRRGHTALVGPSGAGKTTIVSMLLRFLEPTGGVIEFDGTDYRDLSYRELRGRFAYVEQDSPLLPGTVRDNMLLSHPDASDEDIAAILSRLGLDAAVNGLPRGLDTKLTPEMFSGGERQRLALARALLRPVDVLIIDEGTSNVDAISEVAITEFIAEICRERAVVTVTHAISTVRDADLIYVVEAGRIRACGRHADLLERDHLYRELVAASGTAGRPGESARHLESAD